MEARKPSKAAQMADLSKVQGKKFNSFAEFGAALKIKHKEREEKPRKCLKCGAEMVKVAGNVWICPHSEVVMEKQMKDGKEIEVQVIKECGNRVISRVLV